MNVLITGASGGLGRAMAMDCARRGYNLFLTDISASALEHIAMGIRRRYDSEVLTHACDLTDSVAVRDMLEKATRQLGTFGQVGQGDCFDMLLNVAGVDCEGEFTEKSSNDMKMTTRINIEATLNLTHEVLDRRRKGYPMYIVFVSSLASFYPMPLKACYAASKRFLYDFAFALGSELEASGVNVTTVCPGGLATNEESVALINAQGFWGNLTTNAVETIARISVNKVLSGKRVYIPGTLNKVLGAGGKLLPRALIAHTIRKRWQKAQSRRLAMP